GTSCTPSVSPRWCGGWPRGPRRPWRRRRGSISTRSRGLTWAASTNFSHKETLRMADSIHLLLRSNLKQLRLPTIGAEVEKLAGEAAAANEGYEQYLLRLTELEVAARASNAVQARIRAAGFPVAKDFDTFDCTAVPHLNKPKVLELACGEWIEQRVNVCLLGSPGTGKTHVATALGLAACRQGKRVRFFTAAPPVTPLAEPPKPSPL